MLDGTIRAIQGEIALGRLSVGEIASKYRLPGQTVCEVRRGLRQPIPSTDPEFVPRVLEAYASAIVEPLGVLSDGAEPAEPGEEDLDIEGAADRYREARAARRRAARAQRGRVTLPSG